MTSARPIKRRDFACLPVEILSDNTLSGLEIRVCLAVALHDGMSLRRGKGAGCYASYATLANEVGTDVHSIAKCIAKLVRQGHVVKETQQKDRRKVTLRVVYGREIVVQSDNDRRKNVVQSDNGPEKFVVNDLSNYDVNSATSPSQKILLNREIDFVETSELDSLESARSYRGDTDTRDEWPTDWIADKRKVAAVLRRLQDKVNDDPFPYAHQLDDILSVLMEIYDVYCERDPRIQSWAERLHSELSFRRDDGPDKFAASG